MAEQFSGATASQILNNLNKMFEQILRFDLQIS